MPDDPRDVEPFLSCIPYSPLLCASTEGFMKTVLAVRVTAVVGNVSVVWDDTADNASSVRKTSAKDGAGTLTWHVPAVVSQFTV